MKRKQKILLAALFAVLLVALYLFLSSPEKVVVNTSGEIKGFSNQMRLVIQGKRFWREQLDYAEKEVIYINDSVNKPTSIELAQELLDEHERERKAKDEELYQAVPDARPSPEHKQAEELRQQADRIEADAKIRRIREIRAERLVRLETQIIPFIHEKLE